MIQGKCWKFGDDVNTDEIIPARYLNTSDAQELAAHCMEDADPGFVRKKAPGDLIVAGRNFGCGSSREHAPLCIKAAGLSCVIAQSFARIFFRNSINIGLPIFECSEAAASAQEGDEIVVDMEGGTIQNMSRGERFAVAPFPQALLDIIQAGGLMSFVRQQVGKS